MQFSKHTLVIQVTHDCICVYVCACMVCLHRLCYFVVTNNLKVFMTYMTTEMYISHVLRGWAAALLCVIMNPGPYLRCTGLRKEEGKERWQSHTKSPTLPLSSG